MIAKILGPRYDDSLLPIQVWTYSEPAHRRLAQRRSPVDVLIIECFNMLFLAAFVDAEVARLQPSHQFAGLGVAHHDIRQHQIAVHLESESALCLIRNLR